MTSPEDALERARELLPWYLNGTLDQAQRRLVDQQLEQSPALRTELDWLRALDRDLDATMTLRAGDLGLGRLMNRIDVERDGKLVPLRRTERPRWFMPALALAATLVIAQTLVIGVLLRDRTEVLRPLAGPVLLKGTLLQVQFHSSATESQVRELLVSIDGEVVGGPGSLGIFTVRVPDERADEALQRLRAEITIVEAVTPVPR
jgi:anti-sigma factor RsiW